MNHTVNTADIDKRAVTRERFNNTLHTVADGNAVPYLFFCFSAFLQKQFFSRADGFSAASDFNNFKLNRVAFKFVKVRAARKSSVRCRDKYANTLVINGDAALYNFVYNAFKNFIVILGVQYFRPARNSVKTAF